MVAQIQCNCQSDSMMLKMVHNLLMQQVDHKQEVAHGTHARIDKCGCATKDERKMW